mmetsp:Transcript_19448/g.54083  ORF Transcript_19448/g.54083 Transcript_19448/m.54083 type:complete len:90 (+) Transcript_19448:1-270(+)
MTLADDDNTSKAARYEYSAPMAGSLDRDTIERVLSAHQSREGPAFGSFAHGYIAVRGEISPEKSWHVPPQGLGCFYRRVLFSRGEIEII